MVCEVAPGCSRCDQKMAEPSGRSGRLRGALNAVDDEDGGGGADMAEDDDDDDMLSLVESLTGWMELGALLSI